MLIGKESDKIQLMTKKAKVRGITPLTLVICLINFYFSTNALVTRLIKEV